ncbi:unnamed protein product [Ilex paraguariensis]|uniref:Magnesium transporter n=1 Tax=Ilex paraguariensis TaxID=185542 RepID=A0ABC8TCB7_9AQUA
MWESICLTLAATAGNNIGKVLQKKGTVILPPLSLKFKRKMEAPILNPILGVSMIWRLGKNDIRCIQEEQVFVVLLWVAITISHGKYGVSRHI